jgi:tetratricopeptide (TPR) repeat protein
VAPAGPAAAASDDRSPRATPAAAPSAPEPPAAALAAAAGEARADALAQDLAEIDFFIAQGLLEDARDLLRGLEAAHPGNAGVASRARDLERAGERRPTARPEPVAAPAASGGDYLYSVRDVLEPFKKGVERAVGADDAETHYDLGIAYREMGLVDDALGEFEQALRSAADAKRVDALAMIGLCRAEQGDAAAAIAAYRNALRIEGVGAERRRAVEYQLASAYEAAGDRDAALWYLQRILAEEPAYRDVRAAVARLGGGAGRAPEEDAPGGGARQGATADTVAETGAQARSP